MNSLSLLLHLLNLRLAEGPLCLAKVVIIAIFVITVNTSLAITDKFLVTFVIFA